MEVKDWITIASALIIAIGWFVTGYLNRAKDVAQKRLEYRLKMLEAFLPVFFAVLKNEKATADPTVVALLIETRYKFAIYGLGDEKALMEKLMIANEKKDRAQLTQTFNALFALVQSRIRKELKI